MFPFGTVPENLIAFCERLRQRYAFHIGPRETHDAARALEIIDLADERVVRDALRPILSRTVREARAFDQAFTEFFLPAPAGVPQSDLPRPRGAIVRDTDRAEEIVRQRHMTSDGEADESPEATAAPITPAEIGDDDAASPPIMLRSSYSPLDADTPEPPELTVADAQWREAARTFVRRLQVGLARRWRPAAKGRRFDLRRTLRASLQTGGEALAVRWLQRPRRTPRIVLLIDGSRSMSDDARTALQLAMALAASTLRIEVFTFSTALQRVTNDVRRAAAGEPRRLEPLHRAWAGGTAIGACLADFLRRFGDRLIARDTVVVIASDGLDIGSPGLLQDAMRDLFRRSAAVLWLNPLLETEGYEPTARGMRAALPFISTFSSVTDPASLARLSRVVRIRR